MKHQARHFETMLATTIRLAGLIPPLVFTAVFSSSLWAVDCTPDDIVLGSQADIDHFQDDHGPCDRVKSGLEITGADILKLEGLSAVVSVGGDLTISETDQLINLNGLSSLVSVGGEIGIFHNFALTSVDGLSALTHVGGGLGIFANPEQTNVDGLASVTSVNGFMAISDLHSVTNVDGLRSLTSVGNHLIINFNAALTNVDGLAAVAHVGGSLIIKLNEVLPNVDGLYSITSVGFGVDIVDNAALADLNGLSALSSVGNELDVRSNPSLAACAGLSRLIDQADDAEPGPGAGSVPDVGGEITFGDNLDGCNSIEEILAGVAAFRINAGLNDAWFNPVTPGQGFFIIVFPDIGKIFLAWFTYDTERPPKEVQAMLGEPGHRWLTAFGDYADNKAVLDIEITRGGVFDASDPVPTQDGDGTIILEFSGCNAGTVSYEIPSIGQVGVVPIERVALDNVTLCESLEAQ